MSDEEAVPASPNGAGGDEHPTEVSSAYQIPPPPPWHQDPVASDAPQSAHAGRVPQMQHDPNAGSAPGQPPSANPPPPLAGYPPPPLAQNAGAAAPPRRRRPGKRAFGIGLAVLVVAGATAAIVAVTQTSTSQAATTPSKAPVGYDLRHGGVFLNTNDADKNEVVALARRPDGTLREVGRYATGGTGSGTAEDVSGGLVLGTSQGEAAPIHDISSGNLLFVTNPGSDTISVFTIEQDRLVLRTQVPSGGEKPASLTVNHGLLYVLNTGEFDDRLLIGPMTVLENCTHGQLPSVTGFRVSPDGALSQIPSSTRLLSGAADSGCAQVSFTPDGKLLVVTERAAGHHDRTGLEKGAIITFPVRSDGTVGDKTMNTPLGNGPFGFTFTHDSSTLLTTERYGSLPGKGHVASYTINDDGTLTPNGPDIANGETDTCWIVMTNDEKLAFTSNPFGGGTISSYRVTKDGRFSELFPDATAMDGKTVSADHTPEGLIDLTLSGDSRFLYQVSGVDGAIYSFRVNENGTLTPIGRNQVVDLRPFDMGGAGGPSGIAAT